MFTQEERKKISERGSDPQIIEQQIARFKEGFPFSDIIEPATIEKGVLAYTEDQKADLAAFFDNNKDKFDIGRFIPASGAATRMFKSLFSMLEKMNSMNNDEQHNYIQNNEEASGFFSSISEYPFYSDLALSGNESPLEILEILLNEAGLNYGALPKGLLKFHSYGELTRTAFEEHLHEAARIIEPGKTVKLHFTVSEEHLIGFRSLESAIVADLEKQYDVKFELRYSFQKKETDTIAVDMQNQPFRDENGDLVFRPGGHGALIENLNDLENGIIFINNIDNVSPDKNSKLRLLNKKMLAGVLLKARIEVHQLLADLEEGRPNATKDAVSWLRSFVFAEFPSGFDGMTENEKVNWLKAKLDRPMRVCGMVKNEGEPGGGPFFVRNTAGKVSLQIVEASQVDESDTQQSTLFKKSSHFNPVDLVCSVKRPGGGKYYLPNFVDQDTGFISQKSVKGRDLKALELPGLWNGSMAGWNTMFVEIPAATFTPVKTVFDLVREAHKS